MSDLTPRQRMILDSLSQDDPMDCKQIARIVNLTASQVWQCLRLMVDTEVEKHGHQRPYRFTAKPPQADMFSDTRRSAFKRWCL